MKRLIISAPKKGDDDWVPESQDELFTESSEDEPTPEPPSAAR